MSTVKGTSLSKRPLAIAVLGASGDLARKKLYPALFSLYCQGLLPPEFRVYGFARTIMSDAEFRERMSGALPCRYTPDADCPAKTREFLEHCAYLPAAYDSVDSYLELHQRIRAEQGAGAANLLFYMAIPPFLFLDVARALGNAGLIDCGGEQPNFSRVVVEKPFGRDRESSDALTAAMAEVFNEDQTYRIDHYLGKEIVQNLIVLRFANRVFQPVWNRSHIASVRIDFREDFGAEGRAGYFDGYGIIRDIMQNHLAQILALVAMERPRGLDARDIRDEKVKVLRCIRTLSASDFTLGQYAAAGRHKGYLDDPDVPDESITPTFAQAVLRVDNDRWEGVPFLMSAGKALERRATEIRIRFRPVPENIFSADPDGLERNELLIRVQPDESIDLRVVNKKPGLENELVASDLNLRYESAFKTTMPEAYEALIRDVILGDKSLFIRRDELQTAWNIFSPALHEMAQNGARPEPYAYGSRGPQSALEQEKRFLRGE